MWRKVAISSIVTVILPLPAATRRSFLLEWESLGWNYDTLRQPLNQFVLVSARHG